MKQKVGSSFIFTTENKRSIKSLNLIFSDVSVVSAINQIII